MASFFGNISNGSRSQLIFDKVYPNKARLDAELNDGIDNIFIGRFVIIVYDDNATPRRPGYLKEGEGRYGNTLRIPANGMYKLYADSACRQPYKLAESTVDGYGIYPNDIIQVNLGPEYFYFQVINPEDNPENIAWCVNIARHPASQDATLTNYILNYNVDKEYYGDDFNSKGYDATIWKKSVRNGKPYFQMIGCLNSDMPTLTAEAGPPSPTPQAPYYGTLSTNKEFSLWYPSSWGFRVKPAEDENLSDSTAIPTWELNANNNLVLDYKTPYDAAIYYNKAGFNSDYNIVDKDTEAEFSLSTGTSGKTYYLNEDGVVGPAPDLQELKMYFPEIGNAVAEMWNVVYGEGDPTPTGKLKRNKDVQWNSTSGIRMITADSDKGGYLYNPDAVSTLAGSINSVHDLMGMIIEQVPNGVNPTEYIKGASTNRIYYGALDGSGKKKFFFKDKAYKLNPLTPEEIAKLGRDYQKITSWKKNYYYIYESGNFYSADSDVPENYEYYELGQPKEITDFLIWQDMDEYNNIIYYYYKNNNNEYIKDTNDLPDPNKTYYKVTPSHSTNGTNVLLWQGFLEPEISTQIPSEIQQIIDQSSYDIDTIQYIGSGYFYTTDPYANILTFHPISDLSNDRNFNPDRLNTGNYYFYHFENFARLTIVDIEGNTAEVDCLIINNRIVPFSNLKYSDLESNNQRVYFYNPNFGADGVADYYESFKEDDIEGYRPLTQSDEIDNKKIYVTLDIEEVTKHNGGNQGESTSFYVPGYYFNINDSGDYILSNSMVYDEDKTYYRITNKNNVLIEKDLENNRWLIDPIDEKFYKADKYYYYSIKYDKDVLDSSTTMKEPTHPDVHPNYFEYDDEGKKLIYYLINYAYVMSDESGTLEEGFLWQKDVNNLPDGLVLGTREEIWKWKELESFASTLNTIHGLILNVNKIFKLNDKITRDNETIGGMLNQIKDITKMFNQLNPNDVVTINNYGQLTGSVGLEAIRFKNYSGGPFIGSNMNLGQALSILENELNDLKNENRRLEDRISDLERMI